jgi:WD40 repeat protein
VASAAVDGSLAVWSTATGELRRQFRGVNHLAFSPDGRTLAATGRRAEVALWDLESGERRDVISRLETGLGQPFEFAADGRSLFAGARPGCSLVQWDPATRTILRQFVVEPRNYPGLRIAIDPDGRYAAAGVYGGRFVICDLQAERQATAVDGHLGRLESLTFSPRGYLASAAEDGRVCLWRAETAQCEAALTVGPPRGRIHKVVFGDDGRRLATVNGDGTVSIFTSPAL